MLHSHSLLKSSYSPFHCLAIMVDNLEIVGVLRRVAEAVGSVTPSSGVPAASNVAVAGALDTVLQGFFERNAGPRSSTSSSTLTSPSSASTSNVDTRLPVPKKRKRSENRGASLAGMLQTIRTGTASTGGTNSGTISGQRKKATKVIFLACP